MKKGKIKCCKDCKDKSKPLVAHFNFCTSCLNIRKKKSKTKSIEEVAKIDEYRSREKHVLNVDHFVLLTINDISEDEIRKVSEDFERYEKNRVALINDNYATRI